ncbi:MAG: hypothetical protein WED34_05020 [Planctomycetales bacterium]
MTCSFSKVDPGQIERLATIGQEFASISHEARNELAILRLGLEVLDGQAGDDAEAMAIVRRIVEAHDGEIVVGSAGTGAEILFTLPRERRAMPENDAWRDMADVSRRVEDHGALLLDSLKKMPR